MLGADLALEGALEAACAAVEGWGGWPEVLVYNASAGAPGPAWDLDPDRLRADLRVNVGAPLAAVRWALPAMRRAGRGTILFTGGGLALAPKPGLASASLGKAALRSLALSLGEELAPEGIHAATVTLRAFVQAGGPPWIRTSWPKYSGKCTCKKRRIGARNGSCRSLRPGGC